MLDRALGLVWCRSHWLIRLGVYMESGSNASNWLDFKNSVGIGIIVSDHVMQLDLLKVISEQRLAKSQICEYDEAARRLQRLCAG